MERRVFLAACPDYNRENVDTAVHRILDGFGGASSFGVGGKKVLIKANLLSAYAPDRAVTTHPSVVAAIAREFIAAGAKVTIADSPAGTFNEIGIRRLYSICGMNAAAEESGAKLSLSSGHSKVENPDGLLCKSFSIIDAAREADFIVSAAKLKTHGLAYYTGAVKNLFGCIPGLEKPAMHAKYPSKTDFSSMIVDLCELLKPGFSIIDGVIGMEGAGPSGGTPKFAGVIGGAVNPYALDVAMCAVSSLPLRLVPVNSEAVERHLSPSQHTDINYIGGPVSDFKTTFKPAVTTSKAGSRLGVLAWLAMPKKVSEFFSDRFRNLPKITDDCTGCGKCAEVCPRQIIKIKDQRAIIDYSACIKCYCCHEFCPAQAIELVRGKSTLKIRL